MPNPESMLKLSLQAQLAEAQRELKLLRAVEAYAARTIGALVVHSVATANDSSRFYMNASAQMTRWEEARKQWQEARKLGLGG